MGRLIFGASRREDRKGLSLAEVRDFANAAYAQLPDGVEPDDVVVNVQTTIGGKPQIRAITIDVK